ncbi:hypothetical protein [Halodesulfovibrio marinisediminis]|uniref:Uncharacterized protein n=1 Tax=Halodesulfovibrio marinisediminis DSM 17456 TaxID=1121457 RepID=A0A1N6DIU8_9BACT|nr:hypothetical protein [Halodesulfovibrio marinisediminis]SIN70678.1 hypothetical protein SAMN02745161_0190 [Halodesulfovibrio marinisediminis DSM 17456]
MLDYSKFKEVHELYLKGKNREAKNLLKELQSKYISLCDQVSSLKIQVKEYDDILHFSENLIFDGNYYWLKAGSVRHGPFCPECCKEEGMLVRLPHGNTKKICWRCGKQYNPQQIHQVQPNERKMGKVIPLHAHVISGNIDDSTTEKQAIHD